MVVKEYDSPLGLLYLASIGNELCLCSWQGLAACHEFLRQHGAESDYGQEWTVVERARKELDEYFDGDREEFDIPLRMFGTEFQRLVWAALSGIPYGGGDGELRRGGPQHRSPSCRQGRGQRLCPQSAVDLHTVPSCRG